MFTQSAFIRKNTPELREKLTEQGHRICSCCENATGWLFTNTSNDVHAVSEEEREEFLEDVRERPDEIIDCEINEDLFLALTALRDDSDYMQVFTDGREFILCDREDWGDMISSLCSGWRYNYDKNGELSNKFKKATINELIEHFKNES